MPEKEFIFGNDTVKSHRPYQDVIAINDLSDLAVLETRRRRARKDKMGPQWFEESTEDEPEPKKKSFLERIAGNTEPTPKVLDPNVYATKKTIAQGLLDVALLTANASQLKYLLQVGKEHEFYYVMMTLISLSIILQMCLGSVLIIKGRCDINDEAQQKRAETLNNIAVCLVLASTVIHVFLSVFHIKPDEQKPMSNYIVHKNVSTPSSDYDDEEDLS